MPDLSRKLLWALGLSLLVHLALLFGPHVSLPARFAPATVMEAKLTPPPPAPRPESAKPPKPRPSKPRPQPLPVKEAAALPEKAAATPGETAPAEAPNVAAPPAASPAEPEPAAAAAPSMPKRVEIRFTLFKGQNGLSVGRAVQSWKLEGASYMISSVAEATGLFSLFTSGKFIQQSRGEITPAGLKPSDYQVERGQADKTDTARFDWGAMTLTLASGGESKTLKLPEGTQDLLSFMYQLAFTPPQRSAVQLSVTNGRKLDSYAYWVVEEALDTPMGRLKTLHLGKQREPDEKDTEVWLAADYHYLPVKISQVDKDGDGLVLLADEIAITQ